jgi:hypothetical protein
MDKPYSNCLGQNYPDCDPESIARLFKLIRGAKFAPQLDPGIYASALFRAASNPTGVFKTLAWARLGGARACTNLEQNPGRRLGFQNKD